MATGTTKPVTLMRDRLRKHYAYLKEQLIASNYLDDLYGQEVLSGQEKERLEAVGDRRQQQAGDFLDILIRKPEEKIQKFFDIVKTTTDKQPHIFDEVFPEHQTTQEQERLQWPQSSNSAGLQADTGVRGEKDIEWDLPCLATVKCRLLPSLLLDHLREACLLTAEECEKLQEKCLTEEERSEKLLYLLLPRRGKGSFTKFCNVLANVEGQEYIVTEILAPATGSASADRSTREMAIPTNSSGTRSTLGLENWQSRDQCVRTAALQPLNLTMEGRCSEAKCKRSLSSCVKIRQKKGWITFYFKKEHWNSIEPFEKVITATCSALFGTEEEKVRCIPIEMEHLKPMLELLGSSCYLDLTSKLAVLWLDEVEQDEVEGKCDCLEHTILKFLQKTNPHIEFPTYKCRVIEVLKSTSSIVIFLLGVDLFTSLLSSLGSRKAQRELSNGLQAVFPKYKKALLRLSGLPSIKLLRGEEDKDKSAIARQTPQQTNKELPDATQDEVTTMSAATQSLDLVVTGEQLDEMSRPSTYTRDASRSWKSTSTIAAGELDEDAVVTPKQMQRLSKEVGSNWHDIGLNLDVTFQELENIELQQKSLDGRLFQVLIVWSKEKGDQAKVGVLMDACKEAKVGGAAMRALRDQ